ncbi:MAG: ABC transporter substrate-binding protein [Myxococcales bacterium]|jgi:ABC-type branched-subunit amino acid transport system substrate-binding protein/predicted negative regulator of RcsB-dependent stress response
MTPRVSSIAQPLGVLLLLAVTAAFGGCPASPGPSIGRLPALTTDDPAAEKEFERARELQATGHAEEAADAYRLFLEAHPDDPLAVMAELALGRLQLQAGETREALERFDRVAGHREPSVAEQGRFYGGVARQRLGQHQVAIDILFPMVGRTIDPADTALLLQTLADAQAALQDYRAAIVTLDTLASEPVDADIRRAARSRLRELVQNEAGSEAIDRLYRELPKDGPAWPLVVRRAVGDADAAGDAERVRTLLEVMRDEGMEIDDALAAIAMRAERPSEADPRVVGAVLSLSGRARRVGEQALRGLMLAAGLPPQGPPGPDTPRLVFRDDRGEAARAVEAVNELVSVHRAIAIIGPMDAHAAEAAAERAQELGVPIVLLSPAGEPTALGPMVHRLFATPRGELRTLLAHARHIGRRRVATLLPEGPYGDAVASIVDREARALGLAVATGARYPAGATSFGQPVAELARQSFDTLVIADTARQTSLIAPALAAAGLWCGAPGEEAPDGGRNITLLAPAVAFDHGLATSVGRYLQGALFSVPFDARTATGPAREFAERFEAQYQAPPDAFAAFAHDAYELVRAAVDAGARTREALAGSLWQAQSDSLAGPSPGFAADREPTRATRLLRLQGEEFVPQQ